MKRALVFARDFLLGFLIAWTVVAMWNLLHGDNRVLKKKGILVEWFVRSQMEQNDSINEYHEKHTHAGFRITYTYHEPINPLNSLSH